MRYKELQPSELLQHFRQIPPNQHFAIIRFFEQNGQEIEALPTEEYIILLSYYVDALFEEGGFDEQVLRATQELLELSILYGVQYVDGEDVYLQGLYYRAGALLRLGRLEEAQNIAAQLWRLSGQAQEYGDLLNHCLSRQRPAWVHHTAAASMAALMVALVVSFVEILLPEAWHAQWSGALTVVAQLFFALSVASLLLGALVRYYYVGYQMRRLSEQN